MSDKDESNYSTTPLHYDMIDDKYRTLTYCKAIESNASYFKDKVVLDVGSGTGILSLFAARSGAKKVYAVECNQIGYLSEAIIRDNHFENIITVIHGRLEEIEVPEKVDIIVSEWMGYSLYYELMLPFVLIARDKYLNPKGSILPSRATLYLSAIQDVEYRYVYINFWDSVYGFDFSRMKKKCLTEPVVDVIDKWQILTNSQVISEINIHTCDKNVCFFKSPFDLIVNSNDPFTAFSLWFDVFFEDFQNHFTLSTSPFKKRTHWKQTQLYLDEIIDVNKGDHIHGTIEFSQNPENEFGLWIKIEYKVNNGELKKQEFDFQ
ncbi:hypothetical protein M9Y10_016606 [Tritrichomonas musculus]|uniref:Protein arginine N-methyltransferase domain-containing protein n=1 Tax=Tritrichomonas musculus TaxID=1915356 RepID=A0ABR2HYB7_9EUKA